MPANVITDVIIHKLIKEQQQRTATVELRTAPLPVNPVIQRLIDRISKQYTEKVGKGFGKFEVDANEYPAQKHIREHIEANVIDFGDLSNRLVQHLRTRAAAEPLAKGGYVLIAKITTGASNYLLVAVVTEVVGEAITQQLEVVESVHVDLSQLRVAGRVDLTTWLAGGDRYISFLKGKAEVSDYFKLFLGCNDVLAPMAESKKLVTALDDFADQQNLDTAAKDNLFSLAHAYLAGLSKEKQPVELEAFSNHVWPHAPQDLRDVLTEPERSISDGFIPDQRALKHLVKFEGKSQYWRLTFERKALRNREIVFDAAAGTLTLSNLPPSLREELERDCQPDDPDEV
ncbi:nucleoid-associated protein [Rhodoferax sp.]|uniref:nucleoid-associated protein n=1 Tax=Rhodoferax sp. TaxID=50421 RepID=UPI002604830D|nr:nucleoid-associated protein [Rhodoferax sp.]MDD5479675.1 nucleoid-associated protein [Rhodoferax sp.]